MGQLMISRRKMLFGLAGVSVAGAGAYAGPNLFYTAITPDSSAGVLTPPEAHAAAKAGDIILIDIRRPDEWAKTGSPDAGHRVDLRVDDFAPIALICARGVRSARTSNVLAEAGFTNIIDVPEGMLGSGSGPGWIKRGLPLVLDS